MFDFTVIFVFAMPLFLFWYLYSVLYASYRLDKFRQELFEIRDVLFKDAENGNIDFDSAAYGRTRETLNGMIRFAHRITFTRVAIIKFMSNEDDRAVVYSFNERREEYLSELSKSQQEVIVKALFRMHVLVVRHILWSSVILAPFTLIIAISAKTLNKVMFLVDFIRTHENQLTPLDVEASIAGKNHLHC